jgi:predicted acylesterase/phospholipase RssA
MHARLALVVVVLSAVPAVAFAQSDRSTRDTQLQLEKQPRRLIVRPPVRVDEATRDAEQAADAAAAAQTARDGNDPARRTTDYDITSAIQAQTLQRTLRR